MEGLADDYYTAPWFATPCASRVYDGLFRLGDNYVWTNLQRELGRMGKDDQRLRLMIAPSFYSSYLAVYVETQGCDPAVIGIIRASTPDRMYVHGGGEPYIRQLMRDDGIRELVCNTLYTTADELISAAAATQGSIDASDVWRSPCMLSPLAQ